MRMLIKECELALKENRCLGCTALENEIFEGMANCEFNKIPTAEETITQIKMVLGVDKDWKEKKEK